MPRTSSHRRRANDDDDGWPCCASVRIRFVRAAAASAATSPRVRRSVSFHYIVSRTMRAVSVTVVQLVSTKSIRSSSARSRALAASSSAAVAFLYDAPNPRMPLSPTHQHDELIKTLVGRPSRTNCLAVAPRRRCGRSRAGEQVPLAVAHIRRGWRAV